MNNAPRAEVWSCGGGTQSVAIAALIVQGRLPKPDVAVIADTDLPGCAQEKCSTWTYFDAVLRPQLAAAGVDLARVRASEWANNWGRGLFSQSVKGTPMMPFFTNQNETVGKLSNFCSKAWKQETVNRWLSAMHGLTESQRRKWMGFSFDEPRRWRGMHGKAEYRLPLVEDVPMRRHDCRNLVVKVMGWPEPPRSACSACPNQSDEEWLETLRGNPQEFAAAVDLERRARERDPHLFLHRSCVPLDQVDWTKPQGDFVRACNSGECFV